MIPAYICNRDRLTWPRQLAEDLLRGGELEVIILDNASTYPPLLEWYKKCEHSVVRLRENIGPLALWDSGFLKEVPDNLFLFTDPDLDISAAPSDWLSLLREGLRFPTVGKVGLSLRTDDIPSIEPLREEIVSWEARFQRNTVGDRFYWARIDTTLALYDRRRIDPKEPRWRDRALRTAPPYVARHLPWYPLGPEVADEEEYYLKHCDSAVTHWSRRRLEESPRPAPPSRRAK